MHYRYCRLSPRCRIGILFDKRKIDDPVGAISVHGPNGVWGCLSLGLFADGTYGEWLERRPGDCNGFVLMEADSASFGLS